MKLFIDTQIIVWLYCSENSYIREKIKFISKKDKLFIHYHNILEFKDVVINDKYFKEKMAKQLELKLDDLLFNDDFKFDVMREPFPTKYQCRDKDDNFLLNFAIQYGYDGIISNDKDLLALRDKIPNFKIISVDERWAELFA